MLPGYGRSAIYGRGIWSRIVDRRMGVEARPQKQRVLAVLGFDVINALIEPRHPLGCTEQIELLIMVFPEVQKNDTRRAVRLVRLEIRS